MQPYDDFVSVRATVRFHQDPPLGWELWDTDRGTEREGLRRFPRDRSHHQNLFFSRRYWRGMVAAGLRTLPEYRGIFREHPQLMNYVYCRDTHLYRPRLDLVHDFGGLWEALPTGSTLDTVFSYPGSVLSPAQFEGFIRCCGEHVGWSPLRSLDGYGVFQVVQFREI